MYFILLLKVQKVSSTEDVEKNAVIVKKPIRNSQILLVWGLSPRTKFAYCSLYMRFLKLHNH